MHYYISASWRFADADDFNAEMEKYEKMVTWGTNITEDTVIYDLARYGSSQAIFDIRNQTVFYVNASYNNYIPKTTEELKSWVPQKSEWVSSTVKINPLHNSNK